MKRSTDPFEDIERILDAMTGSMGAEMQDDLAVDVADAGDEFVVVTDAPGVSEEDLEITLTDPTTLHIAASYGTETVEEADRYVTRERQRGSFSRRVGLPEAVDESGTTAELDDGILTVTLPKQSTGPDDGTDIPVN